MLFCFVSDCSALIQGKKVAEVADYLEQRCHCGISALYLQGEALLSVQTGMIIHFTQQVCKFDQG